MAGLAPLSGPEHYTVAVTVHDFHMVPYSPPRDREALYTYKIIENGGRYRIRTCVQLSPRQPAKTTSVNLSYLLVLRKRVYYKTFEYKLSRQSNLLICQYLVRKTGFEPASPWLLTRPLEKQNH